MIGMLAVWLAGCVADSIHDRYRHCNYDDRMIYECYNEEGHLRKMEARERVTSAPKLKVTARICDRFIP